MTAWKGKISPPQKPITTTRRILFRGHLALDLKRQARGEFYHLGSTTVTNAANSRFLDFIAQALMPGPMTSTAIFLQDG